MRIALGHPVRVSTEVRDRTTGALTDPDTISLTLQLPDGTTRGYGLISRLSVGQYQQDLPISDLATIGHYAFVWTTTGNAAGVSPPGDFDVFDPFEPAVLPLQDAKATLNIAASDTGYDTEVSDMVATIESALERITGGPLVITSITERVTVGHRYRSIVLRQRPVVSITSITDIASGTALDINDIEVDTNAGIIRRKLELPFWSWGPHYNVTYKAGWATLPAAFNLAARVILQHLWEIQQGPGTRPVMGGSDMTRVYRATGEAFAVPNRALEIMAPYASQVSL